MCCLRKPELRWRAARMKQNVGVRYWKVRSPDLHGDDVTYQLTGKHSCQNEDFINYDSGSQSETYLGALISNPLEVQLEKFDSSHKLNSTFIKSVACVRNIDLLNNCLKYVRCLRKCRSRFRRKTFWFQGDKFLQMVKSFTEFSILLRYVAVWSNPTSRDIMVGNIVDLLDTFHIQIQWTIAIEIKQNHPQLLRASWVPTYDTIIREYWHLTLEVLRSDWRSIIYCNKWPTICKMF